MLFALSGYTAVLLEGCLLLLVLSYILYSKATCFTLIKAEESCQIM